MGRRGRRDGGFHQWRICYRRAREQAIWSGSFERYLISCVSPVSVSIVAIQRLEISKGDLERCENQTGSLSLSSLELIFVGLFVLADGAPNEVNFGPSKLAPAMPTRLRIDFRSPSTTCRTTTDFLKY